MASGLRSPHICIDPRVTSSYPHTPAPVPVPAYRSNTKDTKGQLWLISYFRQLLTTKVTTAHWTCMSSTPTHEWPSSLEMLKEHNILSYTHYSPTKMCVMKIMWATREYHKKCTLLKGSISHCKALSPTHFICQVKLATIKMDSDGLELQTFCPLGASWYHLQTETIS